MTPYPRLPCRIPCREKRHRNDCRRLLETPLKRGVSDRLLTDSLRGSQLPGRTEPGPGRVNTPLPLSPRNKTNCVVNHLKHLRATVSIPSAGRGCRFQTSPSDDDHCCVMLMSSQRDLGRTNYAAWFTQVLSGRAAQAPNGPNIVCRGLLITPRKY